MRRQLQWLKQKHHRDYALLAENMRFKAQSNALHTIIYQQQTTVRCRLAHEFDIVNLSS